MLASVWRRAFELVDGSSLVVVRIAYGVVLTLWTTMLYVHGYVDERYVGVPHHFPFVAGLPIASDAVMFAIIDGIAVLGLFIAAGFFSRACCALAGTLFLYVFLLEKCTYQNHEFLIWMLGFLLALMPVHSRASLSSLLLRRPASCAVPLWCVLALRVQMAVIYVYAGLAKINADWLLEAQPMRTWFLHRTDWPLIGPLLAPVATAYVVSWCGMLFDLAIVPALLWRRTRAFAVVALVAFHVANGVLWTIDVFPVLAIPATLVFLPPSWPRRFVGGSCDVHVARARTPILAAIVFVHVVAQVLIPLRPFVHGGDSSWTEIDHRFSWRMMLRTKEGALDVYGVEPATKRVFDVDASEYVRDFQLDQITWRPDILRDFAVYVAPILERERAHGPVEIHAVDDLVLNGHPSALLVDPNVDLAHTADDAEDTYALRRDDDAAQARARIAEHALEERATSP